MICDILFYWKCWSNCIGRWTCSIPLHQIVGCTIVGIEERWIVLDWKYIPRLKCSTRKFTLRNLLCTQIVSKKWVEKVVTPVQFIFVVKQTERLMEFHWGNRSNLQGTLQLKWSRFTTIKKYLTIIYFDWKYSRWNAPKETKIAKSSTFYSSAHWPKFISRLFLNTFDELVSVD